MPPARWLFLGNRRPETEKTEDWRQGTEKLETGDRKTGDWRQGTAKPETGDRKNRRPQTSDRIPQTGDLRP